MRLEWRPGWAGPLGASRAGVAVFRNSWPKLLILPLTRIYSIFLVSVKRLLGVVSERTNADNLWVQASTTAAVLICNKTKLSPPLSLARVHQMRTNKEHMAFRRRVVTTHSLCHESPPGPAAHKSNCLPRPPHMPKPANWSSQETQEATVSIKPSASASSTGFLGRALNSRGNNTALQRLSAVPTFFLVKIEFRLKKWSSLHLIIL